MEKIIVIIMMTVVIIIKLTFVEYLYMPGTSLKDLYAFTSLVLTKTPQETQRRERDLPMDP